MPLDDTNWPAASAGAPAEDMRLAGQRQQAAPAGSVAVVPAENNQIEVAPAGGAHRAGKEQSDRAGKEQSDRAGKEQDRAGAQCESSAGGEQASPPAPDETDPTTALLIRARSLLERGWCRDVQGQDANGNRVKPTDGTAVAWCAFGALRTAGMSQSVWWDEPAIVRLQAAIDGENIAVFNNRQESVEPVLAAFDRAIAMSDVEGL